MSLSIPSFLSPTTVSTLDELILKQKSGVVLDYQQQLKIDRLPQVMEELQNAMKEIVNVDLDIV